MSSSHTNAPNPEAAKAKADLDQALQDSIKAMEKKLADQDELEKMRMRHISTLQDRVQVCSAQKRTRSPKGGRSSSRSQRTSSERESTQSSKTSKTKSKKSRRSKLIWSF